MSVDVCMAANKTFVSHVANILNIPIQVPKNTESTAKGVACLAGITTGLMNIDLIENQEKTVCNPNNALNQSMEKDYKEWKKLIKKNVSP